MTVKRTKVSPDRYQQGFSLIEVLLMLVLLSATILPFMLMLTQTSQFNKSANVQSTRSLLFSSADDQMDANRANYYDTANNAAMDSSLVDDGQKVPFMNVVDTTNTDSFNKTAYLYGYNNDTDATSAPSYRIPLYNATDVIRMRCGSSSALMDSSGQVWMGDQAYSSSKKQPGYYTAGTTSSSSTDVVNANTADDPLFQNWREATNLEYRFDVPNGDYSVMLYFAEMSGVTTRYLNISLEGTVKNSTPYSAYQVTGGNYRGNIVNYTTSVSDGVLNINLDRDASAGANNPRLSAILIKKWQEQP